MPPIPIHKDAPIKPTGITPQTDYTPSNPQNPPPTRTVPNPNPATTTSVPSSGPPPPQPGARPIPPTAAAYNPSPSTAPPAPQPGTHPTQGYTATHTTTETRLHNPDPPPQFSIPPPTNAQLAGRSTTTSTTASKPGPTTLNMGPVASPFQTEDRGGAVPTRERNSLEHPPGYVQTQAFDHPNYDGDGKNTDGGVGGTAWNMLARAGEALKKGEEAAWRAVGNK